MRINDFKFNTLLKTLILVAVILMANAGASFGQTQTINLTAAPTSTTLTDGTNVPMWGYFCGTVAAGNPTPSATCAALNPASLGTLGVPATWSPVIITVPYASSGPTSLTINLTNNLTFTPPSNTVPNLNAPNNIPTSIMIVGQVGGGLGQLSQRTTTQSPSHTDAQGCVTWFIADPSTPPGVPCSTTSPLASPPAQGPRVQSFGTEVPAGAVGTATPISLTWSNLRPGTYLLESGTHPSIQVPMGLIGMLVVTTAPSGNTAGTAYPAVGTAPAVNYNSEVPLEFSEIDPVQNKAVNTAVNTVGFSETAVWSGMNGNVVEGFTVNNGGSGYTAPVIKIVAGGGAGASATVTLSYAVATASVTGGSGYKMSDVLALSDGVGTGATVTVNGVDGSGAITGATLTTFGSGYLSAPTTVTGGTGTGASVTATLAATGAIASVNLTEGGARYTTIPTVQITDSTGSGAVVTAMVSTVGCGQTNTCYPPAVNYTPFYYLINGVAFNKTLAGASLFPATAGISTMTNLPVTSGITGTVLARIVNAGVRMHVPSIVGSLTQGFNGSGGASTVSGFTLIAEDGNVVPGVAPAGATTSAPVAPRVQTHVFMAAGKVFDVLFNVPAIPSGATVPPALPVYDRALSLSGNSSERDAGMLAYISVNGAALPAVGSAGALGTVFTAATANNDSYPSLAPGQPFTVSDPAKGVIANDINVYGVQLLMAPTNGTVTCGALPQSAPAPGICANGTFTYTPLSTNTTAVSDGFTYCANGTVSGSTCSSGITANVSLTKSGLNSTLTAANLSFTSKMATYLKIPSPGLLAGGSDTNSLPFTVVTSAATGFAGTSLVLDANGGFVAIVPAAGTYNFSYTLQNSLGQQSAPGTVTLTFPAASGLKVNVLDAQAYNNCNGASSCIAGLVPIVDYRWIIEEDKTFWVDPNCTNAAINTPGCPTVVGPSGQSTIPAFAVNFHTSNMDYVAQGCTGPLSCEGGQTVLDNRPVCTSPGVPAGCSATAGAHIPAVCDVGNGACRPDPTGNGFTAVDPKQVHLDPAKRYYISVLPGDAGNPFPAYAGQPGCDTTTGAQTVASGGNPCGHTISGAPIPPACNILSAGSCTTSTTFANTTVNVLSLPTPLPTGKLSIMVFEDDFPLNGEQDGGGGVDVISPQEPGLGGFNIVLWDTYGGLGDVTGQDTYDMFNQPLSNSLAGTIDPATNLDACPISPVVTANVLGGAGNAPTSQTGIIGMIVTCPKYESDNKTLSPLAGQAVVANLMPDKFSVQAYPGADRIARGEEWIQTNTLDGQHPHDSFIRIGEPSYFQEYGPAGYHVSIGFANPAIINARHDAVCAGNYGAVGACGNTIKGQVDVQRLSRTPDQRLYPSGSRDALAWTQCWVSLGDPDAEDFMFTKCDAQGNFSFNNVPGGSWRLTIGDQWNDQIIDGLSTPANVGCVPTSTNNCSGQNSQTVDMGNVGVQQWQSNVYTKTCIDDNKNGICDPGEIGIPLIYTRIRYRDGHNANSLTTDFNGVANFNETFPLFNWYVVESDPTRYKTTGIHTVYDAGGPADGSTSCGSTSNPNGPRPCGTSTAYNFLANTYEAVPLPADLSVPGAVYCAAADCATEAGSAKAGTAPAAGTFQAGAMKASSASASTGRIDPPWVGTEGWSGMTSQGNWVEFAKAPYAPGENGGIQGFVNYASTRPFDSAEQMIQQPWEPWVPHVTVNLYQEGFASDNVTPTLTLVDTTQTSSWDDWAQGFYPNSTTTSGTLKPYMSCPGQGSGSGANADLFFYTLFDQPNFLDWYNSEHNGSGLHSLPYNSQFKCYDSMHVWNQVQPAPIDGKYSFPSSLGVDPTTGKLNTALTGGVGGNGPGTPGYKAASMGGTNCTVCVPNPTHATGVIDESYDPFRAGTPMLPPGKYVVEVIMPPGYEVYKEEDKNLLIGDNFIAPTTQQFPGLGGDIFIIPDQANVATLYEANNSGYNPLNFQNQTTGLALQGGMLSGVPGYPGFTDPVWPCVGEMRVVPDYLSLFPQVQEVAPFAGATRPLCDRKEVTLTNQVAVNAKFAVFTSAHIASKFTGVITDDFTSEFDPFSPQFGEKFAPANMPISTRDYLGNEISRVYSDQFGTYDGLTYSSWAVNPPNITGYSPAMMVQCMNDAGPIPDGKGGFKADPLYNPAYSNFCYEEPYMPGLTTYLDTPVVPTQAFVGAAYNNADCAYPDATPAIAEVDSSDGIGPWVSAAGTGHTLTITALGNQTVVDYGYAGPSASVAPFNLKTVGRHYGFGAQCITPTAGSATCNTASRVTVGGVPLTNVTWNDGSITGTVNLTGTVNGKIVNVPQCTIQQQAEYSTGASTAYCGELVITAGNGQQSVDAVTVTIGGKMPSHVDATATIQSAIDAAAPGDLIIVDPTCSTGSGVVSCTTSGATKSPAAHNEMVIMWKPVRLQGVGAASTIINANTSPAGKLLDPWRRHVNCLFGLTLQGAGMNGSNAYDPNSVYSCPDTSNPADVWNHFTASTSPSANPQVDRLPSEGVLGWDATLNGNLAELLQEPSLMGAYEGAGITVLAKGVEMHGGNPWDQTLEGAFPTGTTLLSGVVSNPAGAPGSIGGLMVGDANPLCHTVTYNADGSVNMITSPANPYPSNFSCNPSSIDGLSITNSSQGGGGVFVHGWAHFLEIANNRVYNNAGTLSGGISDGQGEFGPPTILGGGLANLPPGSCSDGTGFVTNQHQPWCLQVHTSVHNNMITGNSSIGDELFSATLSGGGGATICTGSDYYKFNYNWVCGNLSAGEGGGMVHLGEIQNGDIEHNSFVFNQSSNPTIPTNGGGIMVQGTPDTDPICPGVPDTDCPTGLSDGTGHGLVINANLIQGNSADSGSGGGIRLQQVNGTEVGTFASQPQYWNDVTITNNIIVNNMAGWDGAGISLQDALKVNVINNTIAHNDSLASSGVLTQSIGTPQASAPAGSCVNPAGTASCPQSAGLTTTPNSSLMTQAQNGLPVTCPAGHLGCTGYSNPILYNNIFWQNRAFYIGVGNRGTGNLNQQNLVSLFSAFTNTLAPNQTATGACSAGVSYWDLGVRGDTGPTNHVFTMTPKWSVLSSGNYTSGGNPNNNSGSDPSFGSEYCNGSRVPPECTLADGCGGPNGFGVPPGIADAVTPNPVFSLTPSATVDEGNNWINVSWGPLSLTNPSVTGGLYGNYGGGAPLGNYTLMTSSALIDTIPCNGNVVPCLAPGELAGFGAPPTDFFGNPRHDATGAFDPGAVETQGGGAAAGRPTLTSISPTTVFRGTSVSVTLTGTNLDGVTAVTVSGTNVTVSDIAVLSSTQVGAIFTVSTGATTGARTVSVTTPAGTSNTVGFTVANPAAPKLTSISPNTGMAGTRFAVTLTGTGFTTGSAVTVSGGGFTLGPITVGNIQADGTGTQITTTFTISPTAALTSRNVTVTTTGGPSNSVPFTVAALAAPTLTSVSPNFGALGTSVAVTLTGTNFTSQAAGALNTITVSGGVTVSGVTDVSSNTITATFAIPRSAPTTGPLTVTVATSAGTSNAMNFTATAATLGFSGPAPALTTTPANTTTKTGLVTVSNTATGANAGPFALTATPTVTKVGAAGGTFTRISGGTCVSGTVLNPGDSCTINVRYAPGGSTATATAFVSVTGTGTATATVSSPNFNAN